MSGRATFLEIFRGEANERLHDVVDTLLALEAGDADPQAIESLFHHVHTIKGSAGMLGLDDVRKLAQAMEDILDDLRGSGQLPTDLIDPLLLAADSLRHQITGDGEGGDDLLRELASLGAARNSPVVDRGGSTQPEALG